MKVIISEALNLNQTSPLIVYVPANDNGRELVLTVSGASGFTSAILYGARPDGTILEDTTPTVSGSTVTIDLKAEFAAVVGVTNCTLQVTSGTDNVLSFYIDLHVLPSAISDSAVRASNNFNLMENEIAKSKLATAAAEAAASSALTVYTFKGSCATSALPTSPATGDMWYLTDSGTYGSAGTCVSWSGSTWVALSALQGMTVLQSQITAINTDLLQSSAGAHNSIFRGISLGSALTDAQSAAIVAGTFDDMYIGDYWTIGGVTWRIAGFDIFLNTGDTQLTKHAVTIVPDTNLYNTKMNSSDTTVGGYAGSAMRTANLATAVTTITSAFGPSHLVTRRALLCNAVASGNASGWAWYDSQVELMNECQVYGARAWGNAAHNGYDVGCDYSRFPLFALAPQYITNRAWYWMQDVYSASNFCIVFSYGSCNTNGASSSGGVRPAFQIA